MKIAVDKNSLKAVKRRKDVEYIYLYDEEDYASLKALKLHCMNYKRCDYVDINLTGYNIACLKKSTIGEKDYDKIPEKKNYKIGIIVPNFNYAHTIDKCLSSIAEQTYKNYEVIFIDDVSTDNSVEIAESYKDKLTDLKVIKLRQKRYNGGARNEGYLHLSDDVDYVYYIDSDDWLYDNTALEKINTQLQSYPDVCFITLTQYRNEKTSIVFTPNYKDKYEAFEGWSGSCGKVIKKELAMRQECLYCEGTLKEDKNQHCKICYYMNSFVNLSYPIYVWNTTNTKSVTTIRDKVIWGTSTIRHYADTLQFYLTIKGKDRKFDELMKRRVEKTKKEYEIGGDKQW